jgi:DNA replication protein DnaC
MTPEQYASQAAQAHWDGQLAKREQNLVARGVPEGIASLLCSLHFDETRQLVVEARAWYESGKRFLVLGGPSYRGKTVAAASVFLHHTFEYEWFQTGQPVVVNRSWAYGRFVTCATYQGWHKAPFADTQAREELAEARRSHLLVFDDLGTELSDMRALFTDLVSYRTTALTAQSKMYRSAPLRTVITTNLDRAGIAEAYGDRVLNRLQGEGLIVALKAKQAA